ncbi:MAG: DUF2490 domain-containing protein [Cyclobacteriaceae bacterium]
MRGPGLVLLLTLCISVESIAQKQVNTGDQQWFQYYNTLQIGNQWAIQSDLGIRFRDELGDLSQTLIRSGIEYQWNNHLRSTAGFAFLTFHQDGTRTRVEYRPYQELDLTETYGPVKTQHRFRIEERIFSATDESGFISSFNIRYRYRFQAIIPLINLKNEKKLVLLVGDEILLNSGKEIIYNVFDSNRILIGPTLHLSPNVDISVIYNHLFAQKNQAEIFSRTSIVWVGIKHKIPLTN